LKGPRKCCRGALCKGYKVTDGGCIPRKEEGSRKRASLTLRGREDGRKT